MKVTDFRRQLLSWYDEQARDLPWRGTLDPYAIWVSEIMLQQTRVTTVIPYYRSFLALFPTLEALAAASPEDLLRAWSGLGYYSRARNLQNAARATQGVFPRTLAGIRALPGIGEYTAAAVASIAYGLPHAAVDGNVLRVTARLTNEAGPVSTGEVKRRLTAVAEELLDRSRPGDFNQAMMELGATVCLPRQQMCVVCPVREACAARKAGTQEQLPIKPARVPVVRIRRTVLIAEHEGKLLLWRRPGDSGKLAGFWELPEPEHLEEPVRGRRLGEFRHFITNHAYTFKVVAWRSGPRATLPACKNSLSSAWVDRHRLQTVVLSTAARKAIAMYGGAGVQDKWNVPG